MITQSLRRVLPIVSFALLFAALIGLPAGAGGPEREAGVQMAGVPYLGGEITISARASDEYSPAIAYNWKHDEYLVVWENIWPGDYHDIYAQRISGEGRLLSWFAVSSSSNRQMEPSVAYDPVNDRYLVVFLYDVAGNASNWDVYGRFIPWNGPSDGLTNFAICDWPSSQGHPHTAYARAQEEFLVVWTNFPMGLSSYISGRRIFAAGGSPTSTGFLISSGTETRDQPDVTYNLARNEYLVVWTLVKSASNFDIWGVRLNGSGAALGGGEFNIAGWPAKEERPSVAACRQADQYLVAWQSDQDTGGADYAIYARFLNGDAMVGNVLLIDDTTSPEQEVDVGCDDAGERYLLAWQTRYTNLHFGVWARHVSPNQAMEPAFGVVLPYGDMDRQYPAVAGGRANSLVVWEHERADHNLDIHGRLYRWSAYLPALRRHAP